MRPGDKTPGHHHNGQDAPEPEALGEELHGEFGGEEADELDCCALSPSAGIPFVKDGVERYIIVIICSQVQIL